MPSPWRLRRTASTGVRVLDSAPETIDPLAVALPGPLAGLSAGLTMDSLLVLGLYAVLAGAYLVVVPLALYAWMIRRWTVMGKIERTAVYGLVFLFFPGLILFAPFLNVRLQGQGSRAA